MTTVQPYPASVRWKFRSKRSDFEKTERLALLWEPDCSAMSDEYAPEETSAFELWRMWIDRYSSKYHDESPDRYAPGEVPIFWFVTSQPGGTFEAAPHQEFPSDYPLREDFLTHYTDPLQERTGEPINWLRVPVLDLGWSAKQADKGGFIQEAAGWKPSPLQAVMNVRQVGRAAGIYVR